MLEKSTVFVSKTSNKKFLMFRYSRKDKLVFTSFQDVFVPCDNCIQWFRNQSDIKQLDGVEYLSPYNAYCHLKEGSAYLDNTELLPSFNLQKALCLVDINNAINRVVGWASFMLAKNEFGFMNQESIAGGHFFDTVLLRRNGPVHVYHYSRNPNALLRDGFRFEFTNRDNHTIGRGVYFYDTPQSVKEHGKLVLMHSEYEGEYFECLSYNDGDKTNERFIIDADKYELLKWELA